MATVVIYCRRGFEQDAAAEITHQASRNGLQGRAGADQNSGFATFVCDTLGDAEAVIKQIDFSQLVFARQWFVGIHLLDLPQADRISQITACVAGFPLCGDLAVQTPDTNEGKALSTLCKKIAQPLMRALRKRNKLTHKLKPNRPVLHVMFCSSTEAFVGYSFPGNSALFGAGIPRLKMPSDAPSRSTLKLDEAFNVFLRAPAEQDRIRAGLTAVDLGACPGGWTYQLVRRGLFVSAVDNGAMQAALMETGQVEHIKADGFKYRPKKRNTNVWLVCDMVEKPDRITDLMLDWIQAGDAREVIFNLKLPMKKRVEAVYGCLDKIKQRMAALNMAYELKAKQLYHDREEITVYLHVL